MANGSAVGGRKSVLASEATRLGCELLESALKRSRQNFEVLGCASTSHDLVQMVHQRHPDIVVISADLEDGSAKGFSALSEIRTSHPNIPIVMLMSARNRDLVVEAFRGGARGVVFRSESFDMLCKCLHSVHAGQIWASTSEMHQILSALRTAVPMRVVNAHGDELLTERQKQLVSLVAEGLTNREISQQLHLSEHTVKNYLFRIFDKLGVASRAELIIYALNQQDRAASQDKRPLEKAPAKAAHLAS